MPQACSHIGSLFARLGRAVRSSKTFCLEKMNAETLSNTMMSKGSCTLLSINKLRSSSLSKW
ncbi:Uncharacterised protein [Vibrio cholerae]|nr:Uncharacterised protein [Vibrio cholerae]